MAESSFNNRPSLTITAEAELVELFEKSPALRAYYLTCRGNRYIWPPFSPEDLAQFVIWLIVNNFKGIANIPPIPEELIKFLTGDRPGTKNVIAAAVKASILPKQDLKQYVDLEMHYYLDYLPESKLFHLTSSREKSHAAHLCSKTLARQERVWRDQEVNENGTVKTFSKVETFGPEAISKFLSMVNYSTCDRPFSLTIFGFYQSMMGLGEDCRRLFDVLSGLGYRVELYDCSYHALERESTAEFYEMFETKNPSSEVVIFCMPLFEMARLIPKLSANFFADRYTIGYWPWELSGFPRGWRQIMNLVDEVWASSVFLTQVYSKSCDRPIHYVPLCVEINAKICEDLSSKLIRNGIVSFLTVFDFNSHIQRKNPIGSIKAFKRAFPDRNHQVTLVLKSLNGRMNKAQLKEVESEINGDSRISLFDGPTSRENLNGLIARCSAFLSLHRSEGFGRLLVESMLLGTPVIATDWSGSRDFINNEVAFPIRYKLRNVGTEEYPYASGVWAEPDLGDAANVMRRVAADENCRSIAAAKATKFVRSAFSETSISKTIQERMASIGDVLKKKYHNSAR